MIFRNILHKIEPYLDTRQIIAITGLRRTGKTTIIKYLLNKCPGDNKIFFDFERAENRFLFSDDNYGNIIKAIELEGINFNKKAFISLDEIQLVKNITSIIKYLYDNYNIKFFVTGSSSFYMKNQFSESLAGRKFLFTLHTLAFDEFLNFKGVNLNLPTSDYSNVNPHIVNKLKPFYEEYIIFGGFPEVATISNPEIKKNYLSDILNSYLQLDIKFLADFSTTDEIYKLIRLLSARVGSKVDYTKLSMTNGIHRKKIKEYLIFLEQTYFIHLISPFVINTDREIALQKKIYFADSGLLNISGQVSTGALFENTIANQLSIQGKINYYAKRNGKEIDFIMNENVAIEVKETPTQNDLKKLKERASSLNIRKQHLIGRNLPPNSFNDFVWGGSIY